MSKKLSTQLRVSHALAEAVNQELEKPAYDGIRITPDAYIHAVGAVNGSPPPRSVCVPAATAGMAVNQIRRLPNDEL